MSFLSVAVGHPGDFLPIELNDLHPGQTSRSAVQKAFDDVRSRLTCRVQSDVSDNRSGSPDWFASEQETVAIKEKKKKQRWLPIEEQTIKQLLDWESASISINQVRRDGRETRPSAPGLDTQKDLRAKSDPEDVE